MSAGQDTLTQLEYQYGLPQGVLDAIWGQESGRGRNMLNRSSGAAGHFQLIEENSRAAGIDPNDFGASAKWTAKYAADALKRFPALDPVEAIAAHHYGGPDTRQWGPKTRKYVGDIRARLGKAPDVRMASAMVGAGEISDVTDRTPTGDPVTGQMDMPFTAPQGQPAPTQPPIGDVVSARLQSMEGGGRLTKGEALERGFGRLANLFAPPWQRQQALPYEPPKPLTPAQQLQQEANLYTLEARRRKDKREHEQQLKQNEVRELAAQQMQAQDPAGAAAIRAGIADEFLVPESMQPKPEPTEKMRHVEYLMGQGLSQEEARQQVFGISATAKQRNYEDVLALTGPDGKPLYTPEEAAELVYKTGTTVNVGSTPEGSAPVTNDQGDVVGYTPLPGAPNYRKVQNEAQLLADGVQNAQEMIELIEKHGSEGTPLFSDQEVRGRMAYLYNRALAATAGVNNLGVLQEGERKSLEQQYPNPSNFSSNFIPDERMLAVFRELKDELEHKQKAKESQLAGGAGLKERTNPNPPDGFTEEID